MYCILAMIAAVRYRQTCRLTVRESHTGISILKPLSGVDEELECNLRSYFEQDYQDFELLFAVRTAEDKAGLMVRGLQQEFPNVRARLLLTGEPPYPHDKVYKLQRMLSLARFELVVMSDSDVRVGRDFCRSIAAEFEKSDLSLVTCPYRAVAGRAWWSKLEALSMNTDFHSGLFTAAMIEGTRFAVGPTIVARKDVLDALGGMERVKDYLSSEDFMLGQIAAEEGFRVGFSSYVVEHRIGSETFRQNMSHRLRWARTTRRSRPWGYVGQFFTYPAAALLCICCVGPQWKMLALVTTVLRLLQAWTVSDYVLRARVPWLLLPFQDLFSFGFWFAGFFGKTIQWRGRRYILNRDGTLQVAAGQ